MPSSYAQRQTFTPKKAFQKLGVERKMALLPTLSLLEIDPWSPLAKNIEVQRFDNIFSFQASWREHILEPVHRDHPSNRLRILAHDTGLARQRVQTDLDRRSGVSDSLHSSEHTLQNCFYARSNTEGTFWTCLHLFIKVSITSLYDFC